MWKHDIIQIKVDSAWTVGSNPVCTSVPVSTGSATAVNVLFGPDDDGVLPCAVTSSGTYINIYGLSNDVILEELNSRTLKIMISSFTLPNAIYSSTTYSWTVNLWRWGTTTLLDSYTGSGPYTPIIGTIVVNSWAPVSSTIAKTDVPAGTTLFTALNF